MNKDLATLLLSISDEGDSLGKELGQVLLRHVEGVQAQILEVIGEAWLDQCCCSQHMGDALDLITLHWPSECGCWWLL